MVRPHSSLLSTRLALIWIQTGVLCSDDESCSTSFNFRAVREWRWSKGHHLISYLARFIQKRIYKASRIQNTWPAACPTPRQMLAAGGHVHRTNKTRSVWFCESDLIFVFLCTSFRLDWYIPRTHLSFWSAVFSIIMLTNTPNDGQSLICKLMVLFYCCDSFAASLYFLHLSPAPWENCQRFL